MTLEVSDRLSNRPEQIVEAANAIGRSKLKRKVFEAIYHHKKKSKSVSEIAKNTGLTRMQILQNGGALVGSALAKQEKVNGDTCYVQIPFFQTHKKKILNLAGNKEKILKIATKRNQSAKQPKVVTFEKKKPVTRKVTRRQVAKKSARLKIAFLSTNPAGDLRTDVEIRNVQRILRSANHRDQIAVRHIPAAEWQDLVDTLNEFEPHIVHFSGHGGNTEILFDNDNGGTELNFDLINRFLKATNNRPILLVLNACDTVHGADIFLESVRAVIAMSSSIDDAAADFFATRFYAALANGQSIHNSFEQAKTSLSAENFCDADLPSLVVKNGAEKKSFFA